MRIRSFATVGGVAWLTIGVIGSSAHRSSGDDIFGSRQRSPSSLRASIIATLGSADEMRDAYIFTDVRGLTTDSNGRILVADYAANEVRVFNSTGAHVHTIGRLGAGPGDLSHPCCIAFARDGNLWVREQGNRRYSVFALGDSSARFLRSVPQLVSNPAGALDRVAWSNEGRLVDVGDLSGGAYQRALMGADGSVQWDTIAPADPDSLSSKMIQRRLPDGSVGTSTYSQPFGPRALRAFGPSGEVAMAVSSRYAVTWKDLGGKTIALLRRNVVGPPLSDRERTSAKRTLESIAQRNGMNVSSLPFDVPGRKPPLRAIGFDLNGRLWIERSVPDGQNREADVYDRQGRFVAITSWPSHVRLDLWTVRDRGAIGIASDSLGTISIVKMLFR